MAEGQRRRVLDTGVGGSALAGFAEALMESRRRREDRQARLQELILAGKLSREEKAADPEFQAKQTALHAINQAAPLPELRMNQGAPPEAASRLQDLFRNRMTERLGERAKLSEMFGLAPKRQPTPAETMAELKMLLGDGTQAAGGFQPTSITRGGVRLEQSPEIKADREETLAEARARGTAKGTPLTPQQAGFEQGFTDLLSSINRAEELIGPEQTEAGARRFKGALLATGLPFKPGAGELGFELQNASDILLRLRSGAQINEREFDRLRSLLPRGRTAISEFLGNPGLARTMLQRFRATAEQMSTTRRTKSGGRFSETPRSSTATEGISREAALAELRRRGVR